MTWSLQSSLRPGEYSTFARLTFNGSSNQNPNRCGHCKALAPEYEEAATTLKEKNIALAKVDCTEQADLCKDYGVEGYPTLKVFRGKDDVKPYNGQRKAPAIVSYMVKQNLPAVSTLTSDNIEEFKTQDKVVIVAYHEPSDKTTNQTFTKLADSLRDTYLFGATNDADLAKDAGVKAPAIVLFKQFDEGKVIYNGDVTVDEITPWIKQASIPLIGEVGPETFQDYMAVCVFLGLISRSLSLTQIPVRYPPRLHFRRDS